MRKASKKEIEEVIHKGLVFHKARQEDDNDGKVRAPRPKRKPTARERTAQPRP